MQANLCRRACSDRDVETEAFEIVSGELHSAQEIAAVEGLQARDHLSRMFYEPGGRSVSKARDLCDCRSPQLCEVRG